MIQQKLNVYIQSEGFKAREKLELGAQPEAPKAEPTKAQAGTAGKPEKKEEAIKEEDVPF